MCSSLFNKIESNKDLIKLVSISTFIWMLAGFLYRWLNGTIISHDSLMLNQSDDLVLELSLGRYLQPLYLLFRGDVASPFVIGILGTLFTAVAVLLVVKLLNIEKLPYVIAVSCVMSVNTTNILLNATYINWLDIYSLAMLLGVLAVWCWDRYKLGYLGAFFCMLVLFGLYQAYIQVVCTLSLILIISKAGQDESAAKLLKDAGKLLGAALAAGVAYYLSTKLCIQITGIELSNTYNGIAGIGDFSAYSKTKLIKEAYLLPFESLVLPETNWVFAVGAINVSIMILMVLGIARLLMQKGLHIQNRILIIVGTLLFPLATDCVFFIAKGWVHGLMIYSFCLFYVFALVVTRQNLALPRMGEPFKFARFSAAVVLTAIWVFGVSNVIYANGVFLTKEFEVQATTFTMERVLERMELTEEYNPGSTEVVFVGTLGKSESFQTNANNVRARFDYPPLWISSNMVRETGIEFGTVLTYPRTYRNFFKYFLGSEINVQDAEPTEILQDSAVAEMPEFPASGSCKMINGVMVVKLSN